MEHTGVPLPPGADRAPPHVPNADSQGFGDLSEAGYPVGPAKDPGSSLTRLRPVQIGLRVLQLGFSLAAFGLVLAMQFASNDAALQVKPFAFLLGVSIVTSVYCAGTLVFLLLLPLWREARLLLLQRIQKVLLHCDYAFTLLLFAASCSTATMFPLYCYIGNSTPPNICYKMFGASVVGLMGSCTFIAHFWFLVSPYVWRR